MFLRYKVRWYDTVCILYDKLTLKRKDLINYLLLFGFLVIRSTPCKSRSYQKKIAAIVLSTSVTEYVHFRIFIRYTECPSFKRQYWGPESGTESLLAVGLDRSTCGKNYGAAMFGAQTHSNGSFCYESLLVVWTLLGACFFLFFFAHVVWFFLLRIPFCIQGYSIYV